jgi:DNA-binding transcriptional LysR family regulator
VAHVPELRQLRAFVAIAEAGTVTAAAPELHVAQPSLSQQLRVGFVPSVANDLMPPVVRAFRDHHPQIALRTEDVTIAQLVERVRDGRLDAGLSGPPLVDDLRAEEIGENWVLTPRSSWAPWHRKYDDDDARAGYRPRVVQRADSPQSLLALVAADVGVTRLPLSARSLRDTGVAFVPLAGDSATVVLVTRPDARGTAIETLGEVVRDVAARLDPAAAG